jgi:hypothetical protein
MDPPPPVLPLYEDSDPEVKEDSDIVVLNHLILSKFIDWMVKERDKVPILSSGSAIVNAISSASRGLYTKLFLQCKFFSDVVSLSLYDRSKVKKDLQYIPSSHDIIKEDVMSFLKTSPTENIQSSIVFLDLTASNNHVAVDELLSKRTDLPNDYSFREIFHPPLVPKPPRTSLMLLLDKLLHRSKCPLVFLRLPLSVPIREKLSQLPFCTAIYNDELGKGFTSPPFYNNESTFTYLPIDKEKTSFVALHRLVESGAHLSSSPSKDGRKRSVESSPSLQNKKMKITEESTDEAET